MKDALRASVISTVWEKDAQFPGGIEIDAHPEAPASPRLRL